jgi:hypothetical protein
MLAAAVSGFVPAAVMPEVPRVEGPAPVQEAAAEPGVVDADSEGSRHRVPI